MKTRLIIILFSVPLFIALALMNGALLYFQEQSESVSALKEQALSAAITAAEFTASTDAAERIFNDSSRLSSISAAAFHIKDLDGFYFIRGDDGVATLSPPSSPWPLDGLSRPSEPTVMSITASAAAHPYIVALAPAGPSSFIAVRLDAAPMAARLAARRDHILLISAIAGIIGALLAWHVAHRIVGDLHQNRAAIAALESGKVASANRDFRIRETSDLADAVRLMDASQQAAAKRLELETRRQDREHSHDKSAAKYSQSVFEPSSQRAAGADIAARLTKDAPAGCFFVVCENEDRAVIVLGECIAETPADALALALAARRYMETHLLDGAIGDRLKLAKAAFGIKALEYAEWRANDPPAPGVRLLALTDADTHRSAERYSAITPNASPKEVLDDVEALLRPTGVFAAIKRSDVEMNSGDIAQVQC
ncbi:MAG: hypothetical protein AAF936_08795 [Pseudomonadota bacterium]